MANFHLLFYFFLKIQKVNFVEETELYILISESISLSYFIRLI